VASGIALNETPKATARLGLGASAGFLKSGKTLNEPWHLPANIRDCDHICAPECHDCNEDSPDLGSWPSSSRRTFQGVNIRFREKGNKPMVRTFAFACAVLGSSLASFSAQAEGGCGIGFHRGPYGGCRPNGAVVVAPAVVAAPVVVAPPAVVVAPPVVCGAGFRWHPGFRRCVVL
jgi:hypothetical protein